MPDRVSVVIPARNAARTIEACLAALAAQTRKPDEIVVVDNDSTDGTAALVRAARLQMPVRVVELAGANGPGPVRNAGATAATGTLLAFTDSDCEPRADWLATILAPFERAEVVAVAGSVEGARSGDAVELLQDLLHPPHTATGDVTRFESMRDAVVTGSFAVRAIAFRESGGFDPRLRWLEDIAIAAALLRTPGAVIARAPAALVRHHAPTSVGAFLRRGWKYGFHAATLYRVLWKRRWLVEVTRRLRVDTRSVPGRVWILASPDKVFACAAAVSALSWPVSVALVAVLIAYYATDLRARGRRANVSISLPRIAVLLALDVAWHSALTLGRIAGSPRGRSLCV